MLRKNRAPGEPRARYLEIEGHRNSSGGYSRDRRDLPCLFVRDVLAPYLTEANMLLIRLRNTRQRNDLPGTPAMDEPRSCCHTTNLKQPPRPVGVAFCCPWKGGDGTPAALHIP